MQSLFQHSTTGKVPQFLQNVVVSQNVGVKCRCECAQNRLLFALKPTAFQRLDEKIEASRLEPKNGHGNWWSFIAPQCLLLLWPMFDPKPEATIKSTESNGFKWVFEAKGNDRSCGHIRGLCLPSRLSVQANSNSSEALRAKISRPACHSTIHSFAKHLNKYCFMTCHTALLGFLNDFWIIVQRKIERACLGSWRARSLCPILKYLDAQAEVPSARLIFTFEGQTGVESHH